MHMEYIYCHKNAVERKKSQMGIYTNENCYFISHCKKSFSTEGVCQ